MGSGMESSDVEELRKEVARLSVELEMLKAKVRICVQVVARLREEIEGLKRRARKPTLKEYVEAYEMVEADEPEPP